MRAEPADDLLGREVRLRDIRLGVAVDLLVDIGSHRVLGFDVLCGDDARRFLPLAASEVESDHVRVASALVLMEDGFYRERGRSLAALRGRPVRRGRADVGPLRDVVVAGDGNLVALLVDTATGTAEIPLDDGVVVGAEALRPAV